VLLAATLYDTVGPTLLATLEPDQFISTLDLTTKFLRATRPGRRALRAQTEPTHCLRSMMFACASWT
jgi:acyl-coenzyme A thioesterase PaaI-like protein